VINNGTILKLAVGKEGDALEHVRVEMGADVTLECRGERVE